MATAQQIKAWRQQSPQPYDDYGMPDAYGNPQAGPTESKREKRRREMVDRVSRLHADTLERRDRVFHDLSEIFARTADELLPPPVFGTFDLAIPVGQLPPSLAFTDPVVPDMHPTPYLFALHRLSLERSNKLLAIRLYHAHQISCARRLYEAEVEKIEEEYEGASKGVVDRLLEGVEDRRKRLTDEKEGEGATLDTFLDPTSRAHGTRRLKGNSRAQTARANSLLSNANGEATPPPALDSTVGTLLGFPGISDPFNLSSALLPPSSSAFLSNLAMAMPNIPFLSGGAAALAAPGAGNKRKPGGPRVQPGLPPAHIVIASGQYNQFGKSVSGMSALRADEIEGDLGEVRRKRPRNAGAASASTGTSSRRRANGD